MGSALTNGGTCCFRTHLCRSCYFGVTVGDSERGCSKARRSHSLSPLTLSPVGMPGVEQYKNLVSQDIEETVRDNEWLREEIRQVTLQNEMLRQRFTVLNKAEDRRRTLSLGQLQPAPPDARGLSDAWRPDVPPQKRGTGPSSSWKALVAEEEVRRRESRSRATRWNPSLDPEVRHGR